MSMLIEAPYILILSAGEGLSIQWGAPHWRPHSQKRRQPTFPGACRALVGCPSHWANKPNAALGRGVSDT